MLAAALYEAVSGTAGAAASTTTTVTTSTGPVLRYGARGPVVLTLQQRLATLRY